MSQQQLAQHQYREADTATHYFTRKPSLLFLSRMSFTNSINVTTDIEVGRGFKAMPSIVLLAIIIYRIIHAMAVRQQYTVTT